MKLFCGLWVVCAAGLTSCFSLDRDAFTFTQCTLDVQIEPEQQRLAVRGTITLRNDSPTAQKNAALQISSSLTWRSIQADGKPPVRRQPYVSDIDPRRIVGRSSPFPKEFRGRSVELQIGYEGVILLDATA
jgi:hypothetical protein